MNLQRPKATYRPVASNGLPQSNHTHLSRSVVGSTIPGKTSGGPGRAQLLDGEMVPKLYLEDESASAQSHFLFVTVYYSLAS